MNDKKEPPTEAPREKILLGHLPYWVPLVPPMGISILKGALRDHGYHVRTFDLNVDKNFKELYDRYYNILKKYIPEERRGNFYHIGHDVLQQHMMAHINYTDEAEYTRLVKILIDTIFFNDAPDEQVQEHIGVMREFYSRLETYFTDLFQQEDYDIFGLTVYKGTLAPSLFTFRLAKKLKPDIINIMGGGIFVSTLIPNTEAMDTFLEQTTGYIDKIMIGKGEAFITKLLKKELPETQRLFTLKDLAPAPVPDNETPHNDAPTVSPVIVPDLTDFDLNNYPYLTATASTGCLFDCSFCNSKGFFGNYRRRAIELPVQEMSKLNDIHGTRLFFMTDALLNPIISDLSQEVRATGKSLYYDGYFRVDENACSFENTINWRLGGFYRARLGVESGSPRILEMMDKKITPEQTKATLSSLAYAGIKPTAYFVIGLPDETEEDFQMTLKLLEDIANDIWQAECNPFYYYAGQPGDDIWAHRKKPLYPDSAEQMLMGQTYIVDGEPSREELYNRVFRFVQHCKKLGIPNPYSLEEIYKADERWQKLHSNAVPPLLELMNADRDYKEIKEVKMFNFAQSKTNYDSDFGF